MRRRKKTNWVGRAGWLGAVVLLLGGLVVWPRIAHGRKSAGSLKLEYGPQGLERIAFDGATLTDVTQSPTDAFHIWHMEATDLSGKKLSTGGYGWGEDNSGKSWDAATRSWTYRFAWGSIRASYAQVDDRLNVTVRVENRRDSGIVFEGATVYPVTLHLPERPAGLSGGGPRLTDNVEEPGVTTAEYGTGTIVVVLPEEGGPLYSGLEPLAKGSEGPEGTGFAVLVSGVKPDSLPDAATLRPALRPGESDQYTVSIRFAPAGTPTTEIAGDAYRAWGRAWPETLHWTDRRAIGTVYLASSPAVEPEFAELGGNPRRYFLGQSGGDVNVKSAAGLAAFQQRVLRQALSVVENLRRLKAQGVITWDLEGEQFPQNTSYVCSPDQVATIAPEMETKIADNGSPYVGMKLDDAYFRIIRDAGFRVGVCVRPQHFSKDASGHGKQTALSNANATAELIMKMKFAHDRWGATLFYVDSTVDVEGKTLPPEVLEAAAAALPDSLLIPEESTLRMYRATAPFKSFLFHGDLGTDAKVSAVYPTAFSANLINDVDTAKLAEHRDELTDAVRRGDVLMVHVDNWHRNNEAIAAMYREAGGRERH